MHGAGVLQPGGDPRAVRHHGAARQPARGAARQQEQRQPPAPAQRAQRGSGRRRAAAAAQRRHRRGGRLQQAHGHAVRSLHDMLDAADGMLSHTKLTRSLLNILRTNTLSTIIALPY